MFVIPMAGLSRRFSEAGFELPKYMLPARGKTLFSHAMSSFKNYFKSRPFLFIVRPVQGTAEFVEKEAEALGLAHFDMVILEHATRGQAETVSLGLEKHGGVAEDCPLTIFNIDTMRPGFTYPPGDDFTQCDGWLDLFRGEGDNWSFARTEAALSRRVVETAEKRPISNLCSTGLYHFSRARDFRMAFEKASHSADKNELYVAPLYNHLIEEGACILAHIIARNEVIFFGVPAEYEAFCKG